MAVKKQLSEAVDGKPETWIKTKFSKSLSGRISRNTKPEMLLRSRLHKHGLRYLLHSRIGQRLTLDIDFRKARVAVFVDGHYWHNCAAHPRPVPRGPNAAAWRAKFARIDEREEIAKTLLEEGGYLVLRYRECEIHDDLERVANEIKSAVHERSRPRRRQEPT